MLKEFHKEIEYCTFCPKLCRFSCPVANADCSETSTPWGRQTLLHLIKAGKQELTKEIAPIFYQCAYCLLCREFCDHEIEPPRVMQAAREMVVKAKKAPEEVLALLSFFSEQNNPFGDDLAARVKTLVGEHYLSTDAQVIYFAGCNNIYQFPENITDTFKVFEALGIDYVALYSGDTQCCGEPLETLGLIDEFKELASRNHKALSKYKQIISGCPTCVYYLRVKYPEYGFKLTDKIFHISEFLAPFFSRGEVPIRNLFGQKALYHDPCYLGRYLGIYEQPRAILRDVCSEPLMEFSWNRNEGYCCGRGGGLPTTRPDLAKKIAERRLVEYYEGDDKVLVTACPSCQRAFNKYDEKVQARDIINLVAKAL